MASRGAISANLIRFGDELELDPRLAMGEIEVASGSRKLGQSHLQQLQKDAQRRGFLLPARKAGVALDTRH
jgi:hypothetical protein